MMAVYFKEILDNFRDHRVVINTLLIGPLIGAVIFVAMIGFMTSQTTERLQSTLELPIIGPEHAPETAQNPPRPSSPAHPSRQKTPPCAPLGQIRQRPRHR